MRKLFFALGLLFVLLTVSPVISFADDMAVSVPPEKILGTGILSVDDMAECLVSANPRVPADFARIFAELYLRESVAEGVNHDVAFAQMCLETDYLKFDKLVRVDTNNFGGIGCVDKKNPGASFPTVLQGVRAQIQHLKAYAAKGKTGTWSSDADYMEKIKSIITEFYNMTKNETLAQGN